MAEILSRICLLYLCYPINFTLNPQIQVYIVMPDTGAVQQAVVSALVDFTGANDPLQLAAPGGELLPVIRQMHLRQSSGGHQLPLARQRKTGAAKIVEQILKARIMANHHHRPVVPRALGHDLQQGGDTGQIEAVLMMYSRIGDSKMFTQTLQGLLRPERRGADNPLRSDIVLIHPTAHARSGLVAALVEWAIKIPQFQVVPIRLGMTKQQQ